MTNLPQPPSRIGRTGVLKDPNGDTFRFTVVDEVTRVQSRFASDGEAGRKVLYLQLIRFDHNGVEELRLGYYIIGKKPRMVGRWVWGQYATLMPAEDFEALLQKARAKGWIH